MSCTEQYHAGRSEDLRDALHALPSELFEHGIVLVGYSLGGNMLLKFAAEYADRFPVVAVASVSAPIDLAAASARLLDRRNWIYQWHLLRTMKRECFGGPVLPSPEEATTIMGCRSILEFDEQVVAPRNGLQNAAHYYDVNQARRYLGAIKRPTVLVFALDDPWIPAGAYADFPWHSNKALHPILTRSGGHVGFHARDHRSPYYDRCIGEFIETLAD